MKTPQTQIEKGIHLHGIQQNPHLTHVLSA